MCGIAGIISFEDKIDQSVIRKMTDSMVHRGPDGGGYWLNKEESVAFGHRRLSIIDLSLNGKQPMHLNDRYTITFNGEIYNYKELRNQLSKQLYQFNSETDTEVLLALYDMHKEKCLQLLDGMFAFAIWDNELKKLFCARDRFGEKPFYYYWNGKSFCFASEMKALWAIGIEKKLDTSMMSGYLVQGLVYDINDFSKTFYSNIKQLDNSTYLELNSERNLVIKRYYDLKDVKLNESISYNDAIKEFRNLLSESVKLRLNSDVPVGSSLSGGIDSSTIVRIINELNPNNQNTFSAKFKDFEKDEGKYIDMVVGSSKNIKAHFVYPNEEGFINDLDKIIFHQEEPFTTSSIYAQWEVMRLARNNNTLVLLDGQGADEYLGGYLKYYDIYLRQLFRVNLIRYKNERNAYEKLRGVSLSKFENNQTLRMRLGRIKNKFMQKSTESDLNNALKYDTEALHLKSLLRYADRNSMAHSVEMRLPFLSHKLIEFCFTLPDSFKLKNGWTKLILRDAFKDILPKEIAWRVDKIGYETPQTAWLKNGLLADQIKDGRKLLKEFNINDKTNVSDWDALIVKKFAEQ